MRNSFSKNIFLAILVAVGFSSCTDDELIDKSKENTLGFQIETNTEWFDGEASTSRGIISEEPMTISDKSGAQVLYLHRYSENNIAVDSDTPETRGIPVGNVGDLSSVHKDMSVSAYVGDKVYFANERVSVSSTGFGSISNRYWPPKEIVDFYAQSPYSVSGMSALSLNAKKVRFSYTIPKTADGKDAEKQVDIILSQCSTTKDATGGVVPLRFHHALSAIRFVTRDIAGGTIQKISLKNMYGSGSCLYDAAATSKFAWSISGSANNNYSQVFNVSVNDQLTGEQQVTDKNKVTTFMMLPQKLADNAQIEIVIATKNGGTHTLTGSIGGAVWEAGRIYTYTISTTSINWTYVFEVPNQTAPFKSTSYKYNVTSYRYRTNNPDYKENLSWSASFTGGKPDWITEFTTSGAGSSTASEFPVSMTEQEINAPNTGNNWLKSQSVVGTEFDRRDLSYYDVSGNRISSRSTANCYVVRGPGYYKFPLVAGNAIKNGVANTSGFQYEGSRYIWVDKEGVSHDDEWIFPDKKFFLGLKLNNTAQAINSAYIFSQYNKADLLDCCLIWQDAYGLVQDVQLSSNKEFLEFYVSPKNIQQGNAVVALRYKDGQIIWSWHIWVTHVDMGATVPIDDWDNASYKYDLAPYELGYCEAKPTNQFDTRQQEVVFTQEGGKTVNMVLTHTGKKMQTTSNPDIVYYQFGRKDPMLAVINHSNTWKEQFYEYDQYKFRLATAADLRNGGAPWVEDGSAKPHVMFALGDLLKANGGTVYNASGTCFWNNNPTESRITLLNDNPQEGYYDLDEVQVIKKEVIKTVYDPCPVGFCVPPKQAFRVFIASGAGTYNRSGKLNGIDPGAGNRNWTFYCTKNGSSGTKINVTAFGARAYTARLGKCGGIFNSCHVYWFTADNLASNAIASSVLAIGSGSPYPEYSCMSFSSRGIAKAVRPVKDKRM